MNRSRLAPVDHPLLPLFQRAVKSLTVAMVPDSARPYRGVARHFLIYLESEHPDILTLAQLRRDPHILGWLTTLQSQSPPLATRYYIHRIIQLRGLLRELADTEHLPQLAHLLRHEDIPRPPQRVPRALPPWQDQALQQELLRRNDLGSNVFLLLRHTGMRIGEAVDLSFDCLYAATQDQRAIHVPLGKLKTERVVPVASFVCDLVHRLRFFRSLDSLPPDGRLLARHGSRARLVKRLRYYLHEVTQAAGISARIVPHQLRHTYATELVRSGVTLPVLMKLLGHTSPEMTIRYLDIVSTDVQREFEMARSRPRHLAPPPKAHALSPRADLDGVLDSLRTTQHVMEMFRRTLPDGPVRRNLDRLSNRLTKIPSLTRKLNIPQN